MRSQLEVLPNELICSAVERTTDLSSLLALLDQVSVYGDFSDCVRSIATNSGGVPYNINILERFPLIEEFRLPLTVTNGDEDIYVASKPRLRNVNLTFDESIREVMRGFYDAYKATGKNLIGAEQIFKSSRTRGTFKVTGESAFFQRMPFLTLNYDPVIVDTLTELGTLKQVWIPRGGLKAQVRQPPLFNGITQRLHEVIPFRSFRQRRRSINTRIAIEIIDVPEYEFHIWNPERLAVTQIEIDNMRSYFERVTADFPRIPIDSLQIVDFPFTDMSIVDIFPNLRRISFLVANAADIELIRSNPRLANIQVVMVRLPGTPIADVNIPEIPVETSIRQIEFL